MPPLRWSDRKQIAKTGSLGDLMHDEVPDQLATSVRVVIESANGRVSALFEKHLESALMEHFGIGKQWFTFFFGGPHVDLFIDAVEILSERARVQYLVSAGGVPSRTIHVAAIPDVDDRLNRAFERFRFGYRIEEGEVRRLGSPVLDLEVVGPALLAVRRPGWEEAERSFREALEHQRAGEVDDALTAANAAVEAALKAAGMKGTTLSQLAKSFKQSTLSPGYLENVPGLLTDLLDRLHAARSVAGDAHGKKPDAPEVPQALADLALYWAGAFIVYLAETVP
jgi:hypothetical protein